MTPIDEASLAKLDAQGYVVLEAITDAHLTRPQTLARPNAFICIDGRTYWIKGTSQQGLVAELIAGRLAAKIRAGPQARVIRVTREVLPLDGSLNHLEGVVVGLEDVHNTINSKDLGAFVASGAFKPGLVNPASRAKVIAFQSWVGGANDAQALIGLTDGSIVSIDHGDCFGSTAALTEPSPVVAPIPGVSADVGRAINDMRPAIGEIEKISDEEILRAVSGVPGGGEWRSPVERRLEIAKWLIYRRDRLREVMEKWTQK